MVIFENGTYRAMYYGRVAVSDIARQGRTAFCKITSPNGWELRAEIRRGYTGRDEICHFTDGRGLCYIVSSRSKEKE